MPKPGDSSNWRAVSDRTLTVMLEKFEELARDCDDMQKLGEAIVVVSNVVGSHNMMNKGGDGTADGDGDDDKD